MPGWCQRNYKACLAGESWPYHGVFVDEDLKANQLVDMDWVFGVTASSDSCNEVGKTYLQLKLTFDQNVGDGGKHMHLEMTVDQFFAFLSSMEQCKQFLEFSKSAT